MPKLFLGGGGGVNSPSKWVYLIVNSKAIMSFPMLTHHTELQTNPHNEAPFDL